MGALTRLLARAAERALGPPPRFRAEAFGGIVAVERPAALVYVDRARARALGHDGGARWAEPEPASLAGAALVAPVEVHMMLTSRCPVGCTGCYADSTPRGDGADLATAEWKEILDELAAAGVFHVALGGGESVLREDLLELARHARARGIVPNLTTSGVGVTDAWAREAAAVMGRINVSLDGTREVYTASRGVDLFDTAVGALRTLRRHTRRVGINCVVSRLTYPHLEDLAALCAELGLDELELLRFKPAGRGRAVFDRYDLTDAQRMGFLDAALDLHRHHGLRVRLDCSFLPFLAAHEPDPELLSRFGVLGCEGGNHLAAIKADGRVTACSFWEEPEAGGDARRFREMWVAPGAFDVFRGFVDRAPEPCRSCRYLQICRGGCRAVAAHVDGLPTGPDPGCPKVLGLV